MRLRNMLVCADIYGMAKIVLNREQLKKCPFCNEPIRIEAVKCRYCAEFLNTEEALAMEANPEEQSSVDALYQGRPSLLALVGTAIKAAVFFLIGAALMAWPVEEFANRIFKLGLSDNLLDMCGTYRVLVALGLWVSVTCYVILRVARLKMTFYHITADQIEWSRGIFDRKVDNLDMFRVIDLKLRRSLLDCLFGIGTVELITTDKTDPTFRFEKMHHCRDLYDVIKKASLEADRRNGVIHME
jgi:membrane protein YdbS with pleckstrin-like domain